MGREGDPPWGVTNMDNNSSGAVAAKPRLLVVSLFVSPIHQPPGSNHQTAPKLAAPSVAPSPFQLAPVRAFHRGARGPDLIIGERRAVRAATAWGAWAGRSRALSGAGGLAGCLASCRISRRLHRSSLPFSSEEKAFSWGGVGSGVDPCSTSL